MCITNVASSEFAKVSCGFDGYDPQQIKSWCVQNGCHMATVL